MKKIRKIAVLGITTIALFATSMSVFAANPVIKSKTVSGYGTIKGTNTKSITLLSGSPYQTGTVETKIINKKKAKEIISGIEIVNYTTGASYSKGVHSEYNDWYAEIEQKLPIYMFSMRLTVFGSHNVWTSTGNIFEEYTTNNTPI